MRLHFKIWVTSSYSKVCIDLKSIPPPTPHPKKKKFIDMSASTTTKYSHRHFAGNQDIPADMYNLGFSSKRLTYLNDILMRL